MDINSDVNNTIIELFGDDCSSDESRQISSSSSEDEGYIGVEDDSTEEDVVNEDFLEEGPKRDMQFRSKEILVAAYQAHAKHKGFSRVPFEEQKNGDGSWRISSVCSTHNHELDPSNSVFMAPHRVLPSNVKNQLENYDIAGLTTAKSIRLLEVQASGPQNLPFLKKDCRNYVEKRRRLRLKAGDAEAIHKLFVRLQKTEQNFFHLMDIDDKGRLRNVMWIHPRSIAAYKEFHEVVSFDTTYLVNKYDMPFATVIGVNHHHQSILLGCALLSKENNDSFKWFWRNWLEAMGNIMPTAILTDQCDSIKNALKEVLPNTIHRLCIWHILSKVPKKFKSTGDPKEAAREFSELIYGSITILELEARWNGFVEKHKLEESRWLLDLWDVRDSWIPVYLNHIFWAGMKSTQRSELMHSFFDGYIHSRSSLKQFVEQYEIAICDKIWNEMKADYASKNRVIMCFSVFEWEEQFGKVYTNMVFQLVQAEIKGMMACDIRNDHIIDGDVEKFEVVDSGLMSKYHKEITFNVVFERNGDIIECECKKFECKGILCSHIMKVLVKKNIHLVHERYIMRRWRKDVHRRHSTIFSAGGYPHMTKEQHSLKKWRNHSNNA